jgi:hypothetical protein
MKLLLVLVAPCILTAFCYQFISIQSPSVTYTNPTNCYDIEAGVASNSGLKGHGFPLSAVRYTSEPCGSGVDLMFNSSIEYLYLFVDFVFWAIVSFIVMLTITRAVHHRKS